MSALLIITTGQTDVQLVEGDARRELSKGKCAFLHDEIERRAGEWGLAVPPIPKLKPAADTLPQGAFALCTPKLDAVLMHAREKQVFPTAALILETRRDAQAERGDPRYAGTIVAKRLREQRVTDVRQAPYLVDRERLEDPKQPRDAIIRHEAVNRIDNAIRSCLAELEPAQVIVATTGGFPTVGNLVEEIVRLYAAPGTARPFEVLDGSEESSPTEDRAIDRDWISEPSSSYQVRRHALDLIGKSNLLGAWGAVQHLHADEIEQRWTKVVDWLRKFASSLPIDKKECDIDVLTHNRWSIRAAMRVELALRAEDIPRAVHGTVAFFEAAFWDWLREHDFAAESVTKLNDAEFQLPPQPSNDQRKRFRQRKNSSNWRINDFEQGINAWLPVLNKQSLSAFWSVLTDEIRNLRNDVAHSEPTPALMDGARQKMVDAGLWSAQGSFLTQPLVQNVLRELGEQHPEGLCTKLIQTVRARLLGTHSP